MAKAGNDGKLVLIANGSDNDVKELGGGGDIRPLPP